MSKAGFILPQCGAVVSALSISIGCAPNRYRRLHTVVSRGDSSINRLSRTTDVVQRASSATPPHPADSDASPGVPRFRVRGVAVLKCISMITVTAPRTGPELIAVVGAGGRPLPPLRPLLISVLPFPFKLVFHRHAFYDRVHTSGAALRDSAKISIDIDRSHVVARALPRRCGV